MVLEINRARKDDWLKRCGVILLSAVLMALVMPDLSQAGEAAKQRTFASPEEAVKALIDALKAEDTKALSAIFGPGSEDVVSSGDPVADKARRDRFVSEYEERNRLEEAGADKIILHVGSQDWPFAIPIVKDGTLWHFDTAEGREELLARRIGRNELSVIQVCMAVVDAEREYALEDRNGDGLPDYAQQFLSDPGKKNGLYWKAKEGDEQSPLGPLVAEAQQQGYTGKKSGGKPIPYYGYYYRILKAQGKSAPGGAYDYVVNGKMIGGFALVAYPAKYGASGIMTFIVNQDGLVYQKDLGKDTEKTARAMKLFNPDGTWKKVEEKYAKAKE
jgi:hypothetical protein